MWCHFVPIREMSMADCVALARELGKQVGEELGVPVYLYEAAAALHPERVNLEDVRRGQYELLKEEIGKQAGTATLISARPSLVKPARSLSARANP